MKNSKKKLDDLIWIDFQNLMSNQSIFYSYIDYFLVLVDWIKEHQKDLKSSVYWNRLVPLLDIDIEQYISKKPEILLNQEPQRMFGIKPNTVDSFVMSLCDTLWCLVTFRSGKDCPRCKDDELNYVIAEISKTGQKKVILECDTCGLAVNLDGTEWSSGVAVIHPANEIIVDEFFRNLDK